MEKLQNCFTTVNLTNYKTCENDQQRLLESIRANMLDVRANMCIYLYVYTFTTYTQYTHTHVYKLRY